VASAATAVPAPQSNVESYYPTLTAPAIARNSSGDWAILTYYGVDEAPSRLFGNIVTASGLTPNPVGIYSGDFSFWSVAASGPNFAIGSYASGIYNAALSSIKSLAFGQFPRVGSGPNGFGFAVAGVSANDAPTFTAYSSTGTTQCGPVPFADKNFAPAGVVATPKGYLVVSSGTIRAQEVFADCSLGALFTLDAGPATAVSIAGSAAGYAVVWQDSAAKLPKLRLIGPKYCD
jgi:hypothetical protein